MALRPLWPIVNHDEIEVNATCKTIQNQLIQIYHCFAVQIRCSPLVRQAQHHDVVVATAIDDGRWMSIETGGHDDDHESVVYDDVSLLRLRPLCLFHCRCGSCRRTNWQFSRRFSIFDWIWCECLTWDCDDHVHDGDDDCPHRYRHHIVYSCDHFDDRWANGGGHYACGVIHQAHPLALCRLYW